MDKKPLVSVIVPVHNAGRYIWDLLDSLVYQTLDDIEIILIENSSTDNTLEIIGDFQRRFPEKIICESIPPTNGPTPGRIRGLQIAKADYLYLCDADDLVDYQALQKLYEKAISGGYDLVYGPAWNIAIGKECRVIGKIPDGCPKEAFLYRQVPSFWTKLIHRSLIEKVGYPDDSFVFDDIAYIPVLCSYANKIGCIETPVYYYFRREDSEVNSLFSVKSIDTIRAEKFALEHCNPEFRESILIYLANRNKGNLRTRWYFLDLLVKWLKELWPEISEIPYVQNNKSLYNYLVQYTQLPDTEIPKTLIISGFGGQDYTKWSVRMKQSAFNLDEAQIICLNEENCDLKAAPQIIQQAYREKNWEFVGHYFALHYIADYGGIYLDTRLRFSASLNLVLPFHSFFGYLDGSRFTDKIFGAQPGEQVIRSLLKTYELDYGNVPLMERIKTILIAEEDVCTNGFTNLFRYPSALFGPEVFLVQTKDLNSYIPPLHVCDYMFSEDDGLDLVLLPRETLYRLCNIPNTGGGNIRKLQEENIRLKRRLKKIKNSRSWRITKPLRKLLRRYRNWRKR